jgi:hypothetical protein
MREEIVAGIRNGLARGQSLEKAAQSMMNAGYNPQEVKAAVQSVSGGASSLVNFNSETKNSTPVQTVPPKTEEKISPPRLPTVGTVKKSDNKNWLVILLVFLLIIIIGAIGYLVYYLTK